MNKYNTIQYNVLWLEFTGLIQPRTKMRSNIGGGITAVNIPCWFQDFRHKKSSFTNAD